MDEKSRKLGKDIVDGKESGEMDHERFSNSKGLANGNYPQKYNEVDDAIFFKDGKQTSNFEDGVDLRVMRKTSYSEKMPIAASSAHSHENHLYEKSYSTLLKSPDWSRGRSRSRSIVREASVDEPSYIVRKHQSASDEERAIKHAKKYRHSSRDDMKVKERERSSSRYAERTERHYSRETRDIYREGSKETRDMYREGSRERDLDRDRTRAKEREMEKESEREGNKLRDRHREEKEQEVLKDRSRDRDWDRGRERERRIDRERDRERERNKDRDRGREGGREGVRDGRRARSRDKDYDIDRLSRHQKYSKEEDDYRDRDNDSRYRRNSEDYHRDRTRRSDLENGSSNDKQKEQGNENKERYIFFIKKLVNLSILLFLLIYFIFLFCVFPGTMTDKRTIKKRL